MKHLILSLLIFFLSAHFSLQACTGLSLQAKDGAYIQARTIEWGESDLPSEYVIIPRGRQIKTYTPEGLNGATFQTKYGMAGLAIIQKEFIAEGLNEAGLSAGLFYFPRYGSYSAYDPAKNAHTVNDLQLVTWMLAQFSSVDEVRTALPSIRIIGLDKPGSTSTVHWRIGDSTGKQAVLEIVDGIPHFYDNPVGVLTNSPGFDWQMTNLNNYVNLRSGSTTAQWLGHDTELVPFGAGSGFLGIPGDVTPPSRFVRAAFYQSSAPRQDSALQTVLQCFRILGSFEIPIGIEFSAGEPPTDIPSATQWTSAADLMNRKIYYNTMYNSAIRCIDLRQIDFSRVKYRSVPLDETKHQSVETLTIR